MQDRPVCFSCTLAIQTNAEMVFEAPCGHLDHASAVFHAICLFDWRDTRRSTEERFQQMHAAWHAEQEEKEQNGKD